MTESASTSGQTGRICARVALLFWASFTLSAAFGQDRREGFPIVTTFTQENTGANMIAWNAVQDPEGKIHFGGHELVSYDGQRWTTTALTATYALRGMDLDRQGRLWAGAVGELGWFEPSRDGWVFHSLQQHLPFDSAKLGAVWQVFAGENGVTFVTEDKILRWNGEKFQVWPMPSPRRLRGMRVNGTVYVQHRPSGLYAMTADGPSKIIPAEALDDNAIFLMEPRGEGNWFFVTHKGLFNFTEGKLQPFAPEASSFIETESVTSATRLPDGRLAVGTFLGGIALLRPDGAVDKILNETNGLPTRAIYFLFVDAEKGLWAASSKRIFRLSLQSPSQFFDQRSGLPDQQIRAVLRHRGQLAIATENDVYFQSEETRQFQRIPLSGRIADIRSTKEGLVLGRPYSAVLWSDGVTKVLHPTSTDANIAKPSRLRPENYLISEGRKIVLLEPGKKGRSLVENLPDVATSIAEDARGQLWIGTTTRGVLSARPDAAGAVEAAPPDPAMGLPKFSGPASAVATQDGAVVVLAPEGGWLLAADSDKFSPIRNYRTGRKLAAFSYLAADNSVWAVYAEAGAKPPFAARIEIQKNQALWQPHAVEGLWQIGSPWGFLTERDDAQNTTTLWIGGTKGLLRHSVPNGPLAPAPQPPLLSAYSRTNATGLQPIVRSLPYSTNAVHFRFAAPQYSITPTLRLETFIEGIDRDWVPAEASAQRELTALRDGEYVFRVRTVAETGVTSAPASFRFEILPPWWRSTPAVAGVLLALAPGVYALYRLRVRALRRRNADLEEKVSQRTAQLAKASAAKTEFVANMSHDIRNPLNGIVGLALALEDTRLDPRQREIVSTLRECTTYLSSLVDDVLDFARIEAGQIELRPGPFAPAELLRAVATTLKGETAEWGAVVLLEVDPQLPRTLLGDAGRIQQILVNYTSNALKYAGGTIRLSARLAEDSRDEIEFGVIDEGPGIEAADLGSLFTKFNRLPNARGEIIKGSGLGLAACRSLADIMGGSVGVQSRRGVGSTFYLRLPLAISEPAPAATGIALPSATVLIVEDADYNAWAASAVLAKLGLPCERAATGTEALELFTRKRFDIVLLDRNLPDMDGTEVAKRIRLIEADNPRAILLAVTAYCTAEDRALCLSSGMDAFVGKPLTPDKLRKVLLAAGRRQLAAASVHIPAEVPARALDVSLLSYISDGTDQGLGEQIERFVSSLGEAQDKLEHASSARDFPALAASAHYVVSQAKMVGGGSLEEAATGLERAARAGDGAAFGVLIERVREEIRVVTEALRHRRPASHPA
ncbi:MAG TPA: ATP-binding protein [Opitutaceae bacterium]|nr:ATP-binding protein [Opitutaceae bacterium]